jgi:hypothetical protein
MDIALHLGAHLTDEGRLLRCLVKNREVLLEQGIEVPGPGRYRDALIRMAAAGIDGDLSADSGHLLLDASLDSDGTERVILSEPNVLSWKSGAVRAGGLYLQAGVRMSGLRSAFSDHQVHLFLAIRNPASLLPALLPHLKPQVAQGIGTVRPDVLRWGPMIASMRQAWPEAAMTIWCDEDTPFIWHRILQAVSGHDADTQLAHTFDWFNQVMIEGGAEKLDAYLTATPPVDDVHRQRVIAAFLDKYYDSAKVDVDVPIPEWTEDIVDMITDDYEADVAALAAAHSITLIQP